MEKLKRKWQDAIRCSLNRTRAYCQQMQFFDRKLFVEHAEEVETHMCAATLFKAELPFGLQVKLVKHVRGRRKTIADLTMKVLF
jgi:hypothetical protein